MLCLIPPKCWSEWSCLLSKKPVSLRKGDGTRLPRSKRMPVLCQDLWYSIKNTKRVLHKQKQNPFTSFKRKFILRFFDRLSNCHQNIGVDFAKKKFKQFRKIFMLILWWETCPCAWLYKAEEWFGSIHSSFCFLSFSFSLLLRSTNLTVKY